MTAIPPAASAQATPPFTFEAARAPHWFAVLMIVLFALLLPVGYLGDEGEALVTAVGGAAALSFVLQRRLPPVGVVILTLLTAWAVASFAWSPLAPLQAHPHTYNQLQALTAPKLVFQLVLDCAFVSGALKLSTGPRTRAMTWLAWTLWAAVAVLMLDGLAQGQITGVLSAMSGKPLTPDIAKRNAARGCYAVALMFWPAALFTWRKVPAGVPVVIGGLIVASSLLLGVDAPAAAMILSLLVFAGVRMEARLGAWACAVGAGVYVLAAPLVFLPHGAAAPPDLPSDVGKLSWHVRLDVWRFASRLIAHRPLLGYGLDSSRAFEPNIPMHPHDMALQLWLELGVPGALLGALFFGWLFYKVARLARSDPAWAAVACATGSVYLLIGAISFGVWQEWWLALGAAAVAACGMLLQVRREAVAVELPPDGLVAL
ncbi:O-antigen ligase [Caulobacter sp. S45]|uniref:O-antigen ligase family protein n=1 Tax=Caulobacter sp. S45 TaxID=1641861 RepID=UPI001576FC83|nr:O-antigen ligase family protein [Caulobacter sp. S45]